MVSPSGSPLLLSRNLRNTSHRTVSTCKAAQTRKMSDTFSSSKERYRLRPKVQISADTDTPCHKMPHQRLVKTMQMIEQTGSA